MPLHLDKNRKNKVKPSEKPAIEVPKPKHTYNPDKDLQGFEMPKKPGPKKKPTMKSAQSSRSTVIRTSQESVVNFRALRTALDTTSADLLNEMIADRVNQLNEIERHYFDMTREKELKKLEK